MKKDLRTTLILLLSIFISFDIAQAQSDNFVYAMTSITKEGSDWIVLRKLNTQTGEFNTLLTNDFSGNTVLYDALNKTKVEDFSNDTITNSFPRLPFANGVAAIALDKEANRLYFTPMSVDQLRYVDLSTMKIFCVTGQSFGKAGN